jgi:oxygen-dependent protoporphyrinogen oxidase
VSTQTMAVVGSGPAGLAAAFRLHQAGYRVRMFEANDYVGGRMKTVRRDGFLIEEGAIWMPNCYTSLLGIAREAGLSEQIVPSRAIFGFQRDGGTHIIDCDHLVRTAPGFSLLSNRSKLLLGRLFADVYRHRHGIRGGDLSALTAIDDESAEAYTLCRLNREILDHIVNPTLRGIAGDSPARLSKLDLFYTFATFLGRVRACAFKNGMSSFTEALASRFDVELDARVLNVTQTGDQVKLTWQDRDGVEHVEQSDGVVVAVPPTQAEHIHSGIDPARAAFLRKIQATPVVNITVALRTAPPDMSLTYIPVSEVTNPDLLLVGLLHNLCPGRAPAGRGLISAYPAPAISRELYDASDEVASKRIIDSIAQVVPGLIHDVEFVHVNRWDPLVLLSWPGYYRELADFVELSRQHDTRIQLAGDYFSVSSMNTASASGERAARDLLAANSG